MIKGKYMQELTKEDKWLLVSCLQKSVRKGFTSLAVDYASRLYDLERSYLVYRLSIIAVEDVGLGNLALVNEFMDTEIKKANIEAKGGKEYVLDMTAQLANSIKDRSACDLTSLCGKNIASNKIETLCDEDLTQLVLNTNTPLIDKQYALWNILGAKKQVHDAIVKKEDNPELFFQINEQLLNTIEYANEDILSIGNTTAAIQDFKTMAMNCLQKGYKIHREPHFMAFALLLTQYIREISTIMEKYKTGDTVSRHYDIVLANNFWLVDGVDWHTKNGKNVIYEMIKDPASQTIKYLKNCAVNYEFFAPILGTLLFRAVGQQVQERLVYPSAINISRQAQTAGLNYLLTHNSNIDLTHLQKIFLSDLPLINEKIDKSLKTPNSLKFPL